MHTLVAVKAVPDLVEELEIDESGSALDTTYMRLMLNELDEHAIEQAILLKERIGGQVTIVTLDDECSDEVLYTAAAKGADRLVRLMRDFDGTIDNHTLARVLGSVATDLKPDLILTGVQAHDDLDGSLGPLVAEDLDMPYIGYVSGVTIDDGQCTVRKEFPGGLIAEMEVSLPAVLGVQAADEPPRYMAISRVRQAMKTATIEERGILSLVAVSDLTSGSGSTVNRMFQPETGERATMIEGDGEEIAAKLVIIFKELGVL